MILVRHAHAESKARWDHDESLRPLSVRGELQAEALDLVFATDAITKLWSSPTVRCRQTLAPLATRRGLDIVDHPLLAKGADPERLLPWVLAHAGEPWAVCTHGEVFEALFRVGRAAGMVAARPMVTEKGAAWRVVGHPDGSIDMEYVPPRILR
ncbi:SixA phosphatase family protein [Pengzhenrongella sicca]|uniref:Histidine phosphatase family protein n=1 Tax=Pengzhenrongella sicca TaxID=2819238 RepID=A0A8A4Z8I8_9MICO|nr:phosphoglycerate mutase family protein [Pengzhenrongella sicca]QTE28154.1 histidine phosphatase family protein [Pengzhenrongella sicca]